MLPPTAPAPNPGWHWWIDWSETKPGSVLWLPDLSWFWKGNIMDRPDHKFDHAWHVALNDYNAIGADFRHWMYEAKNAAEEVPRLALLFALERKGELPDVHRQCSFSQPEPIKDNHLSCCLGTKCAECPHLLALEVDDLSPEQQDMAKAWTCTTHILFECGKNQYAIDTSEGYILTVGDKMFWATVYEHLSAAHEVGGE